jgi:hypothetical protein
MMVSLGATGASAVMIRFWNVADLQANAAPFQFKLRQLVKVFFPVKLVSYSTLRIFFCELAPFGDRCPFFTSSLPLSCFHLSNIASSIAA